MDTAPEKPSDKPRAIVAGYGIPGRATLEVLLAHGYECSIIEMNAATVRRMIACGIPGATFIEGDATSDEALARAGVAQANMIVVAVPVDSAAMEITRKVRAQNPTAKIITRCQFTSAGMEARQLGANEVVIAEQAVALAMRSVLQKMEGER